MGRIHKPGFGNRIGVSKKNPLPVLAGKACRSDVADDIEQLWKIVHNLSKGCSPTDQWCSNTGPWFKLALKSLENFCRVEVPVKKKGGAAGLKQVLVGKEALAHEFEKWAALDMTARAKASMPLKTFRWMLLPEQKKELDTAVQNAVNSMRGAMLKRVKDDEEPAGQGKKPSQSEKKMARLGSKCESPSASSTTWHMSGDAETAGVVGVGTHSESASSSKDKGRSDRDQQKEQLLAVFKMQASHK